MIRATLGVIGHVDHGKTALVRALTGMETDRLPEERRRGISIALGFAHLQVGEAQIDLIDMPGHERFVRTMIAGASGIDAVLLVVAANEHVKPQTEEHVAIAGLLGIRHAVIAISKCDLVDGASAALAAQAAAALAAQAGLQASAPVLTSSVTGAGIDTLRMELAAVGRLADPPEDRGFYWLPIDRAFSVSGHGTVATGTLRHGMMTMTSQPEVLGTGMSVRLRGLQVHGKQVASVQPGQRVAVNLRGIAVSQVAPGSALGEPGLLRPATWFSVHLRLLGDAPRALRTTDRMRLLVGTMEAMVRVRLLDRDALAPGQSCVAQLHSPVPLVLPMRERFILRETSPARTVGGGLILESGSMRLRRRVKQTLDRLQALATEDTPAIIVRALAEAASAGCWVEDLAHVAGLAPSRIAALLGPQVVVTAGGMAVLSSALDTVLHGLRTALETADAAAPGTAGLTPDALLATLRPTTSLAVLEEATARLVADRIVRRDGGALRLYRQPEREQAAADQDLTLALTLTEALLAAGLQPPNEADLIAGHRRAVTVLRGLVRDGVIVRAVDRAEKRVLLFHCDAVHGAQTILMPLLASGPGLLAKDAGVALGVSRKYSIPLLEHLDAIRFTRRIGDRRVLFGQAAKGRSSADID
jgi:selenocysteine-specific elongation factor